MSTATPGPWDRAWCSSGFDIVADGPPIAHIHFGHDMKGATANSHLISAAPDLFVALRLMVDLYVAIAESGDCGFFDPELAPQMKAARAAIAKAGGKGQAA